MSDEIVLIVNGKPHKAQANPETPLLYVLRNELGLTGPQFGCGEEMCGACMVLIGNKARQSCRLAISEVGRSRITTLEGLIEKGVITIATDTAPDGRVTIAVKDTGTGFDELTKMRLFEPFFTTKAPGQGTGLGLAVVLAVVEEAKGDVYVESSPGRGALFELRFPAAA